MLPLEASGLCKRFGSVLALDGVDLRVEPGDVCGLIGPNGAGKTTLLRMLLGLVQPDAGRIEFFGREPSAAAGLDAVAGFVEEPRFYPYLTARRTLELFAELDGGAGRDRVGELLDLVGLAHAADRRVGGYSTGMRQRLGLALALLGSPRLLLLDEPMTGLDPAGAAEMLALVRRLAADHGVAVVLSSHDMDAVADICTAVTILMSGRVVWDGSMERLQVEAPPAEYRLETSDDAGALALSGSRTDVRARGDEQRGLVVAAERGALDEFVLALAAEGIAVRRLAEVVTPVEAMFLELTGGTAR